MLSDVRVLVVASVRRTLARQRVAVLVMVAFVAGLLAVNGVVGAGVSRYAETVTYRSALTLVEISAVAPSATRQIDAASMEQIRQIPGVVDVHPWFQVDLTLGDPADWPDPDENPGPLWGTPEIPGLTPDVVAGAIDPAGLADGQVALPHAVPGGTLDHLVGSRVVMEYTRVVAPGEGEPVRVELDVVATVDNSTPGEAGPAPSYLPGTVLAALVADAGTAGAVPDYTTAYVQVESAAEVPAVQRALAEAGFGVSSVAGQMRSLGGLFAVLGAASWILGVILVLVCLGLGGAIGSAWVQQRTREIGLLTAIGWSRRTITGAVLSELAVVGAVASVGGVVLGALISVVATGVIAGQDLDVLPVDPWQPPSAALLVLTLALVPVAVAFGGLRSAIRAATVDADDALRDL